MMHPAFVVDGREREAEGNGEGSCVSVTSYDKTLLPVQYYRYSYGPTRARERVALPAFYYYQYL